MPFPPKKPQREKETETMGTPVKKDKELAPPDMAADIMLTAEGAGAMKPLEDVLAELGRSDLKPADVMAAAQDRSDLDKLTVDELAKKLKEDPELLDELDVYSPEEEEPSGPYKKMTLDSALRDMTTEKEEE